jgi:hypothetical protein
MVKQLMFKTMKLLKLAKDGESCDDPFTCSGFMDKIIRLERRSHSLPKGSPARSRAVQNMADALNAGLKEFGSRWAK